MSSKHEKKQAKPAKPRTRKKKNTMVLSSNASKDKPLPVPVLEMVEHCPKFKIVGSSNNSIRVKGKDLMTTITVPMSPVGTVISDFDWRPVSTTWANTSLNQFGNMYEKYRIKGITLHYATFQAFTVGGGVICAIRYDPADPVPSTATSLNTVYSTQDNIAVRPVGRNYSKKLSGFPDPDPQRFWFTQAQSEEERLVDAFNHLCVIASVPSAAFDIQIWVEYDLEFFERVIQLPVTSCAWNAPGNFTIAQGSTANILTTMSAASALSTNQPLISPTVATSGLMELPNGAYYILMRYIASATGLPSAMIRDKISAPETAIPIANALTAVANGFNTYGWLFNNTGSNKYLRLLLPGNATSGASFSAVLGHVAAINQDIFKFLSDRWANTPPPPADVPKQQEPTETVPAIAASSMTPSGYTGLAT